MSPSLPTVNLPATATDLTPSDPARIGPYRPLKRLGAGGMGVVYAAHGPDGALVALKLIHSEYAADEEFRARFRREVDLLRKVGGACAVPLLASDTDAERPWLVTPLVRGLTLNAYMREHGPLDEGLLIGLAAGLAEALTQIHSAGIVHRDLKPSNVILSPDGPRVLDFGVARALDQTALTRTGGLMGSPGWISPAHYQGKAPVTADDVFAWGALVAYAATGRLPFGGGDPSAVAHRVISGAPDTAGFDGPLAALAHRALAKDASYRPTALELVNGVAAIGRAGRDVAPVTSAEAAGGAMAALVDDHWDGVGTVPERTFTVPPERGPGRGRIVLAVVGAAVAALVVLAGVGLGGVALARNWDSLPVAAWFEDGADRQDEEDGGGGEADPTPSEEPSEEASPSEDPSASPSASPSDDPSEGEEDDSAGDGETTTAMATVGSGVSAGGDRPSGDHVVAFRPEGGSARYALLDGATVTCAWSFCQSQGGGVANGASGTVSSSPQELTGYVNSGGRTIEAHVTYTTAGDGTITITHLVEQHRTSGSGTPPW